VLTNIVTRKEPREKRIGGPLGETIPYYWLGEVQKSQVKKYKAGAKNQQHRETMAPM